jgi:hypothetical protein
LPGFFAPDEWKLMYPFYETTLEEFIPQGMTFDANDMLIFGLAFDLATDREPRADRNLIARTIFDDGARGQRNVEKLCAAALVAVLPTPQETRYLRGI